ncbi:FAD-dependent monooxygenase [Microbacterium flavescens]|jgi:2-polyprenyl-6-methoxyphenol hydroxylase-like FAD-dependent oxidoreductase|uniref:FAD-dependent monooxygenase n=1 Tax=Microbacterium flavescens TaxID=69366 RepID=UPI001BDEC00E|nr:FAD-dependent monooxygenase [Microbacterium flavescens]
MDVETDVIVVGAGPSGLMAATCLARLGVRVVVIDGKSGPTRESRALGLQARSVELYDQLGLAERVLSEATRAPSLHPGYGRTEFGTVPLALLGQTITPFPGIQILEQSRNERILRDACEALGATILWRHELVSLDAHEDDGAVSVVADGPDGSVTLRAAWLVGADGASSAVRRARGIPFEGTTNPLSFFVTDALDATGLAEEGVNVRVEDEGFMLAFPMGGPGHQRLLGIADESPDVTDEVAEEAAKRMLADRFGVEYTETSWFSRYRTHHRIAARFRDGRVFLVGDAAHVHSPVGAQGMNTGLQDAHNLACKLAQVVAGDASEEILDEYEHERRPVAERLVRTTDAVFSRVTSRSRLARFVRTRLLPLVGPLAVRLIPRAARGERLYGYVSQTRIRYRMPGAREREHVLGRRLPWTGDNYASLRDFTWQLHGYGVDRPAVERIARSLGVQPVAHARDPFGRLAADRVYLVRPDGFVAGVAAPDVAVAALHDALGAITRQTT